MPNLLSPFEIGMVDRAVLAAVGYGHPESMPPSCEALTVEEVTRGCFLAVEFKESEPAVYLAAIFLYPAQIIGQAEDNHFFTSPERRIDGGNDRRHRIGIDGIAFTQFGDVGIDPAVAIRSADPVLSTPINRDDAVFSFVGQRIGEQVK